VVKRIICVNRETGMVSIVVVGTEAEQAVYHLQPYSAAAAAAAAASGMVASHVLCPIRRSKYR